MANRQSNPPTTGLDNDGLEAKPHESAQSMSLSHQAKDLRNGVCPSGALGSMPDLEIGHTRFSALQYRKSNSGFTPDRSLLLKQAASCTRRENVSLHFIAPAISNGLHLPGQVLTTLPKRQTSTHIALANSQTQGYSSFDQETNRKGASNGLCAPGLLRFKLIKTSLRQSPQKT